MIRNIDKKQNFWYWKAYVVSVCTSCSFNLWCLRRLCLLLVNSLHQERMRNFVCQTAVSKTCNIFWWWVCFLFDLVKTESFGRDIHFLHWQLKKKKKKRNWWLFPEAESADDSRWVPRLTLTYPPRRHIGIASGKSTLSLLKWPWPLKWNVLLWCGKVILHHLFPCRSEKYPFIWHLNSLKNPTNETFFWKVVVYYIRR